MLTFTVKLFFELEMIHQLNIDPPTLTVQLHTGSHALALNEL